MDASFVGLIRCPACRTDPVAAHKRFIVCQHCGAEFPLLRGGYIEMLDPVTGDEPVPATPAQKLMESELIARVYDRVWRPTFVRIMAGRRAGEMAGGFSGEFFIHKNSLGMDERSGPWLDLSCGSGLFTRAMAAAAPGHTVVGLDISRAMLEAAGKRLAGYDNVTLVRADAQDLPFRDRSFSGINNAGALHVYDEPDAAFAEVYRVLQPGGVYVGSTYAESSKLLGKFTARVSGIRRFDPAELHAWLSRIGFSDYEEVRMGDAFIFKTRKP